MMLEKYFYIALYIWIGFALVLIPLVLKVTAPYGRHTKTTWGPVINNKAGWILMELPALAVFIYFYLSGPVEQSGITWFFFTLWVLHYSNRVLIFPLRIKTKKKKMPLAIILFAFIFNLFNGFFNGYYFGYLVETYAISWLYDPRFIIGVIMFFGGMYINLSSDEKLIGLRKSTNGNYSIPHGGMFRYISCPNFFGEIIEWTGFAILTWCLPAASFAIWSAVNLIPRALDHHKWYRKKFEDYPEKRKAIIPYLF